MPELLLSLVPKLILLLVLDSRCCLCQSCCGCWCQSYTVVADAGVAVAGTELLLLVPELLLLVPELLLLLVYGVLLLLPLQGLMLILTQELLLMRCAIDPFSPPHHCSFPYIITLYKL